ncbi:MAG: Gfo/Idh/MocA family protein [Rhodothermales bacterium]
MKIHNLGAAVVGTGFIGPVHVEGLIRLGIPVHGVMGSSPAKSESARNQMGLEKAYASFDEVLADDRVDVVHLAVPNVLHYDMSKRALAAGKHVMCEKPLAMNAEESAELVELAAKSGLAAGVCYNLRFYPLNLEARARIQSGSIGDVLAIKGSYVQDWLLYDTDYNWRVLADQGGELRAVSDIGTHWMDLVTSMTGLEIEAVFADLKTVHPVRKRPIGEVATFSGKKPAEMEMEDIDVTTDDAGTVLLRFSGGQRAVLWVSQVTAGRKNCMQYEISGSKGALSWNGDSPNSLWIGHRNKPNEVLEKDPSLLSDLAWPFANYPGGHHEGYPDTFKQCFRAFYTAIAEGIPAEDALYPTFAEGHKEIQLCDAILQSHREERWVSV